MLVWSGEKNKTFVYAYEISLESGIWNLGRRFIYSTSVFCAQ